MTMRCVSLWQPWASGVAEGLKTWETRSWSTDYRGELAVASTSGRSKEAGDHLRELLPHRACPQGAVLAVARLANVFPVVAPADVAPFPEECCIAPDEDGRLRFWTWDDEDLTHSSDDVDWGHELAWGDYTPGRFAWVLENVRRLEHPVPVLGRQRIYYLATDVEAKVRSQL